MKVFAAALVGRYLDRARCRGAARPDIDFERSGGISDDRLREAGRGELIQEGTRIMRIQMIPDGGSR